MNTASARSLGNSCAVKIGTGVGDGESFDIALDCAGVYVSAQAYGILTRPEFTVSSEEKEIQVVIVSVADLGFRKGAYLEDVCEQAEKFGLSLCPAEIAPQLCLQMNDQLEDKLIHIGMQPITNPSPDGYIEGHEIFIVVGSRKSRMIRGEDNEERMLHSHPGYQFYKPDEYWAFCRK